MVISQLDHLKLVSVLQSYIGSTIESHIIIYKISYFVYILDYICSWPVRYKHVNQVST